ncbi:MAG: polysaccharide biosynthesis tyrosine autokinase [Coriobacteriia bacterium]|nr:polysaccharide biosynthesis tyrosine autokinase [Coriobacteriia bacterium]
MEELDLRDYLNVIRARKWVIIQAVVVVTLVALIVSLLQSPVYEGEAKVLISEKGSSADLFGSLGLDISSQPERGLQTQVQLMQVRPLLENTIRKLDLGMSPEDLAKRVEVSAVGQTNIVTIVAKDGDAQAAADIANTLAEEFVGWSREYKRESITAAADEVETRLEAARGEILELGRRIQREGKSDDLSAELAIATGNYTTLAAKLEELRIQAQLEVGSGRIVSPAAVAEEPVEPSPLRNTALGLVVGLVFGLGLAFLYEYLDNTIKSSEEAEKLLGVPVLGLIPAEKYDKDERRRASIITHPGSAAAEAYRVLRNNLDYINFQHDLKTLLVTSAAPAEGKSTVAANLTAGLAQAGKKVVLVACDFRKPTAQQFFGVPNVIGLSDVLAGSRTLKSALQRPMDNLDLLVLTSGKLPPNPSELLGSEKMKTLLDELKQWADWVIIDTPPLLAVADGAAVARYSDGVLLVTKGGSSTREAVKKAGEMLESAGGRLIGSTVWGLDAVGGRGGYGYGYGRGYGYGGYYSYADYYNAPDAEEQQGPAHRAAAATGNVYIPAKSPGRKLAESLGRVMSVVLAILAVVAVAALVVYFLDQALGWGIVGGFLGRG